jgi:uncharacterized protein (TIGR02452 family)
MQKSKRADTARHTVEILEKGYYIIDNQLFELTELINTSVKNSLCILENEFEPIINKSKVNENNFKTQYTVNNETTLQAAERWAAEKTLVLNFASAKNPGGGFLTGASAQEESLARSSALYPCLCKFKSMYDSHKAKISLYYNDDMIYSPQVPVFKNDEGDLLKPYYSVSFITCAAVNQGALLDQKKSLSIEIERVMRERIFKVLSLAAAFGYTHLVLGAWGCGVFRNEPDEVARWFFEILKTADFKNKFEKIHFAVLDSSKNLHIIAPFERYFSNL